MKQGANVGDYHIISQWTKEIIPPEGHIIPPKGCIILPEGRRKLKVEEGAPEGRIMQPV